MRSVSRSDIAPVQCGRVILSRLLCCVLDKSVSDQSVWPATVKCNKHYMHVSHTVTPLFSGLSSCCTFLSFHIPLLPLLTILPCRPLGFKGEAKFCVFYTWKSSGQIGLWQSKAVVKIDHIEFDNVEALERREFENVPLFINFVFTNRKSWLFWKGEAYLYPWYLYGWVCECMCVIIQWWVISCQSTS